MDEVIKNPQRGDKLTSDEAMLLAIQEAKRGAGRVSPNPLVGCVILDSQNGFLASGYHAQYGGPHAEVHAVKKLQSEELRGAQVFVTLEPCAHEGKTPSCAKMLKQFPLKSVTYGLTDPNPLVSGAGAQILKDAGIEAIEWPHFKEELKEVCEHFLWNFTQHQIFISVKVASSLDGQLALKTGESKWITGEKARLFGHFLRGSHDATLVGAQTVLIDNPSLDIRHPDFADKKNKVIVIDRSGRVLEKILENKNSVNLTQLHESQNLFFIVAKNQISNWRQKLDQSAFQKINLIAAGEVKSGELDQGLDLNEAFAQLWTLGVKSILVEGGAHTISKLLKENLVNRLYLFQGPLILGSESGKSWTEAFGIDSMQERLVLKQPKFKILGSDMLITGRLKNG